MADGAVGDDRRARSASTRWNGNRRSEIDDVLGRLGGVFYGNVMEYQPGRELVIADAWWLPPDSGPIGPMSLQVQCAMDGPACRLHVRQSGFEDTPRWRRYYGGDRGGLVEVAGRAQTVRRSLGITLRIRIPDPGCSIRASG